MPLVTELHERWDRSLQMGGSGFGIRDWGLGLGLGIGVRYTKRGKAVAMETARAMSVTMRQTSAITM